MRMLLLATASGLSFTSMAVAESPSHSADVEELLSLSLDELGEVVYSASRELTTLEEAPTPITVITAGDIKRHGYRNLRDALERTVGFITYADNYAHIFGHRGFVEDGSHQYLYMIDGHALNNQLQRGPGQEHILPRLSHVKRIEIIRSPSSTLWGAEAAAGIVHIITYDGEELAGKSEDGKGYSQLTLDYEFENKRKVANFLHGHKLGDDSDIVISLNASKSDGDLLPVYHADNDGYVLWPDARPWDPRWNTEGVYGLNHEFYAKYRKGDFMLIARDSRSDEGRPILTKGDGSQTGIWIRDQFYIDARYAPKLSDRTRLELSLFMDDFDFTQGFTNAEDTGEIVEQDYLNYGASAIVTHNTPHIRLKVGAEYEFRKYNDPIATIGDSLIVPNEFIYGVFAETFYSGIEDWGFTFGVRYDYNDLRSKGGKLYLRAAVFNRISDAWGIKYSYNSGHVRPTIAQYRTFTEADTFTNIISGAPWVGVDKPQTTEAHDIQLTYSNDKLSMELTLFNMEIRDYVTYVGYTAFGHPDPDLYGYEYIDANLGKMKSQGIEIEGSYAPNYRLKFYGNFTYARTTLADRYITFRGGLHTIDIVTEPDMDLVNYDLEKTGAPQLIWNLGVDFEFAEGHQFNLHYRGWAENPVKSERQPNEYDVFGPEHFVDLNYVMSLNGDHLELSAYVKNLLDNDARYPSPNDGGYIVNMGRTFGFHIKYSW